MKLSAEEIRAIGLSSRTIVNMYPADMVDSDTETGLEEDEDEE